MSSHVDTQASVLPQLPNQTAVQTMAQAPSLAPVSLSTSPALAAQAEVTEAPAAPIAQPAVVMAEHHAESAQPQAMGGLMGALLAYRDNVSKAHIAFGNEQARAQAKLMELKLQHHQIPYRL